MEKLQSYIDFSEGLDFFTKYGLIISNFLIIAILLVVRQFSKSSLKEGKREDNNILFVTAHPDDEAMFFLPTIKELHKKYTLHLLCLSNGNYDKLGQEREQELQNCCRYLKIDKLKIVNDQNLQDGPISKWSSDLVAEIIENYVQENDIKAIITFDDYGVSGHGNHISVYKGVEAHKKSFGNKNSTSTNQENQNKDQTQSQQNANQDKNKQVQKYYKLESLGIVRKYMGLVDFFMSVIFARDQMFININPFSAWKSMQIHKSQFVWYRKLFVIFSRYAYINTLQLIK